MSRFNSTPNQDTLERAIARVDGNKTSTVEDVISMLTKQPKPKDIISNSKPKKRRKVSPAKLDVKHIPKISDIPDIPDGFPEGTVLNADNTLTLPDGRTIRKIEELDHEEAK